MKLQFLVPQYKEPDEVIKPLLDSIAIQQGIPFEEIGVIICNDGSDVFLTDDLLKSYKFRIEYHKEPHRGVSGTRNVCLDYAEAEYVMFCDADDMFFNSLGLWIISNEMTNPFDCLVSRFVEEAKCPEVDFYDFVHHDNDAVFVHGKVYRRKFLIDKNLRFDELLTIHEDSFFNILCQAVSERTVYCETAFYLWKYRDDSVCRRDPKYIVKTYPNLLDSDEALLNQFLQRGMEKEATNLVGSFTLDSYYTLNKPDWLDHDNLEYRMIAERCFAEYFKKYKYIWDQIPNEEKISMSEAVRKRNVSEGMQLERTSILEWLEHIVSIGKEENGKKHQNTIVRLLPVFTGE